jgi:hypothetical protein
MKRFFIIASALVLFCAAAFHGSGNIQNIPTPNLWIGSSSRTNYLQSERAVILRSETGKPLFPE